MAIALYRDSPDKSPCLDELGNITYEKNQRLAKMGYFRPVRIAAQLGGEL
jgi:hypothetical protein